MCPFGTMDFQFHFVFCVLLTFRIIWITLLIFSDQNNFVTDSRKYKEYNGQICCKSNKNFKNDNHFQKSNGIPYFKGNLQYTVRVDATGKNIKNPPKPKMLDAWFQFQLIYNRKSIHPNLFN